MSYVRSGYLNLLFPLSRMTCCMLKSLIENSVLSFNAATQFPINFVKFDVQVQANSMIFLGGVVFVPFSIGRIILLSFVLPFLHCYSSSIVNGHATLEDLVHRPIFMGNTISIDIES